MKYKTFIAKALIIGIVLNSISTLSYANTEIPNRYQTLEGEYITIDDSVEGNLEEIEIFGNTIQDENNLEDIQSVGYLYVDEDGNPILDSQGREQYKIDILSSNYTCIKDDFSNVLQNNNNTVDTKNKTITMHDNRSMWMNSYFEIKMDNIMNIGDIIDFSFNTDKPVNLLVGAFKDFAWQGGTTRYTNVTNFNFYKVMNVENMDTIRIQINSPLNEEVVFTQTNPNRNKATILLPTQLQKAGNATDKLYWDNKNKKYIIEKNVGEYIFSGNENVATIDGWSAENSTPFNVYVPPTVEFRYNETGHPTYGYRVFINGAKSKLGGEIFGDDDGDYWAGYSSTIRLRIPGIVSVDECKEYIRGRKLFYPMKTPEIIETNITSKLKIPTYDEKTHIYADSENGISPTLKVVVDRLPKIAKEAVAQAESDSSNYNISLARMYINMLPESLYKDQLQDQLNEVFSSDMVLDSKTATSNLDLYIKCENALIMSLSINSITFDDFSGVEDMTKENAVQISINSSLPYSLNAYLPTEIQNSDKSNTMNKDILNIKESGESTYQTFTNITDKIVLKDNNSAGNDLIHNIDIKLKGGIAHEKDVYKTTIKLEAEQK